MKTLVDVHAATRHGVLRLYDSPYSPNARKVRAVAAELGLDIEFVHVDLLARETRSAAFLKLNPNGKLPVIMHDGWTLWESNAILGYLAALRPEAGLHPKAPQPRAEVDRWLFWQVAHFSRPAAAAGFERLVKPALLHKPPDETIVASSMNELRPWLAVLDRTLSSDPWLARALSIADFAVGAWAELLDSAALLDDHASIRTWLTRLDMRPSWSQTRGHTFEHAAVPRSA